MYPITWTTFYNKTPFNINRPWTLNCILFCVQSCSSQLTQAVFSRCFSLTVLMLQIFWYERYRWSGEMSKEYAFLSSPLLFPCSRPVFVRAWRRSLTYRSLTIPLSLASLVRSSSETENMKSKWSKSFNKKRHFYKYTTRLSLKKKKKRSKVLFIVHCRFERSKGYRGFGGLQDKTININYVVTHGCMWKRICREAYRET